MYPLKFVPIVKEKIWGGNKLHDLYGKNPNGLANIGESWELSGYPTDLSFVQNGSLAGKSLQDLLTEYKEKLVGDRVYRYYGNSFPLLFKLIHAEEDLSIQVHPGDEIALKRHDSLGKTEMWYVLHAAPNATLVIGFKEDCSPQKYLQAIANGNVESLLQKVPVKQGDVFFIPAGLVHAIGKGVIVAEIQESSDITYRLYDYNRRDDKGNMRDLHVNEALDVMDFSASKSPKRVYSVKPNVPVELVSCRYFTTNILEFADRYLKNNSSPDTFIVYMCLEGDFDVHTTENHSPVHVAKGETVMLPASIQTFTLIPTGKTKVLEIYI